LEKRKANRWKNLYHRGGGRPDGKKITVKDVLRGKKENEVRDALPGIGQ